MTSLDDIRRLYTVEDVLERGGIVMGRRRCIVCPLPMHQHARRTASFSIFTGSDGIQRFRCHGTCGAHGDVIDLAGYLWIPGYDPKRDVLRAVDALRGRAEIVFPVSETPAEPTLQPSAWRRFLPIRPDGREYMRSRGLTDETIDEFRIGQDGVYVTIPTFEDGRLTYIKKRAIVPGVLRFTSEEGSRRSLFNHDLVAFTTGTVFYVKAEIPAMLLVQNGYKACAPTTGENSWDPRWAVILSFANIVVVGDNDEPGRQAAAASAERLNAKVVFPPGEWKDIDAWLLDEPIEASMTLVEWSTP